MSYILAIDPGCTYGPAGGSACAWFGSGVLHAVEFARRPVFEDIEQRDTIAVVERPEYQGKRSELARIQDLISLAWAGAAAAYSSGAATVIEYTPSQWKGSEPKPVNHRRAWAALEPHERAVLGGDVTAYAIEAAVTKGALRRWAISGGECYPRKFLMHNLLDAVALGLFHLGRLEKR